MFKKTVPLLLTFLMGLLAITIQFVQSSPFPEIEERMTSWIMIITAFSIFLGVGSLLKVNLLKIQKGHRDAIFSLVLLLGFLITASLGIMGGVTADDSVYAKDHVPVWNDVLKNKCYYIFTNMIKPMQSTMFALLAFFVASAAYRAFRVKNFEATVLLVAAFLVMLGRVPIGSAIWSGFPVISSWIMENINMPGSRAITFGTAIGTIAMSLKIMLGIERGYMGGGD